MQATAESPPWQEVEGDGDTELHSRRSRGLRFLRGSCCQKIPFKVRGLIRRQMWQSGPELRKFTARFYRPSICAAQLHRDKARQFLLLRARQCRDGRFDFRERAHGIQPVADMSESKLLALSACFPCSVTFGASAHLS